MLEQTDLRFDPVVPGSPAPQAPIIASTSGPQTLSAPPPFQSQEPVTIDTYRGLKKRDRVRALFVNTRIAQQSKSQLSSVDIARQMADRQQLEADEMERRVNDAYARLSQPPPVQGPARLSRGELLAAVLGGVTSGDFEASNRAAQALAQVRSDREFAGQVGQFQADQRLAGLKLDSAQRGLGQARDAIGDLERFKLNQQIGAEQDQKRTEEARVKRLQDRYDSIIDDLQKADSPGDVKVLQGQLNRLGETLGIPPIDQAEIDALSESTKERGRFKGEAENRALLQAWGREVDRWGGNVPEEVANAYKERAQSIADQFGVNPLPIVNPGSPTLKAGDTQFKQGLATRKQDANEKNIDADNARADLNTNSQIQQRAAKTALDQAKFDAKNNPFREVEEVNNGVQGIRAKQSALGVERKALQAELGRLNNELQSLTGKKDPLTDTEQRAANALVNRIGAIDSRIANLNVKNAGFEAQLKSLSARRKELGGFVPGKQISNSPFEPRVRKIAQESGVDPDIAARVMQAESSFNPSIVSSEGAIGLMQLMPGTASALGVNPRDPEQNMRGGVAYLKQMLDMFDGDYELALAAYNAGPGNVRKYGGVPPFKETQNYVAKILGRPVGGRSARPAAKAPAKPTPEAPRKGTSLAPIDPGKFGL